MQTYFHFILTLFYVFLFSCENQKNECDKYFPPENITVLSLESIGDFWKADTIENISDYVTASFNLDSNHIESIFYLSCKGKAVAVSVFSSKESAIAAMEYRINEVSAVILPEDSCYSSNFDPHWCSSFKLNIEEKCWYGQYLNFQRSIFINKWNTIVETVNLNDDFSDSSRILLAGAVLEVAKRVDKLSYCLETP